jgi:hypothetical protein
MGRPHVEHLVLGVEIALAVVLGRLRLAVREQVGIAGHRG